MVINMSARNERQADDSGGLVVEQGRPEAEVAKPEVKRPPLYKVVMLNDDYTPMEFVEEVMGLFFYMDQAHATGRMWEVHTKGRAVCGIFTYDIAETKVSQVIDYARSYEYPLLCTLEPE